MSISYLGIFLNTRHTILFPLFLEAIQSGRFRIKPPKQLIISYLGGFLFLVTLLLNDVYTCSCFLFYSCLRNVATFLDLCKMDKLHEKLGKTIANKRKGLQFSQEAFALKAGIHRTYVSQIERGLKSPTLHVLSQISKAFDVSLIELVNEFYINDHTKHIPNQ